MNRTPNPERARWLRKCGYTVKEIVQAMNEEGRDVHIAEVTAWLAYATPPKLYDFENGRHTIGEIAKLAKVDRWLLEARVKRGMSIADAITRPISTPAESARFAKSPWRVGPSVGGGSR